MLLYQEEKSPTNLELLSQEKKVKHVEVVPAANKWLNITAQVSDVSQTFPVGPRHFLGLQQIPQLQRSVPP